MPISVFWLVPQYALHGMSDALSTVGHMELFHFYTLKTFDVDAGRVDGGEGQGGRSLCHVQVGSL